MECHYRNIGILAYWLICSGKVMELYPSMWWKSGIFCGVSELLAYHGWSRATQDFGAAPQLLTMDANALGLSKKLATHGGPYNMMVFLDDNSEGASPRSIGFSTFLPHHHMVTMKVLASVWSAFLDQGSPENLAVI